MCNFDQPGGGLCNMDRCYKWQYLYKVLGKCFIGYIYRNIVQYCTWYNHSIRIRYNTYIGTLEHAFWVRVSFPEVQSLVEASRTDLQIAWPHECAVRVFTCHAQAHRNDNTGRCREWDHSIQNHRRFLVWENTTCKERHPRELTTKVTTGFACKSTSRGLNKELYCRNDVASELKCM